LCLQEDGIHHLPQIFPHILPYLERSSFLCVVKVQPLSALKPGSKTIAPFSFVIKLTFFPDATVVAPVAVILLEAATSLRS